MKRFLHDLFIPHFHNNYRSRFLHHSSLVFAIIFLFLGSFATSFVRTSFPQVLGIATDITAQKLLLLTNQDRQSNGAGPLVLNSELNDAAASKANDMFAENYWAHNSPTGKTPWVFIKNSGYQYVYAGENLARGFTKPEDVVNAWMASPTHRENMLSTNYTDVGFAVKEGKLLGEETVLVVEMFGNTTLAQNKGNQMAGSSGTPINTQSLVLNSQLQPLIDSASFSRNFALIVALLFISVLVLDMLVVQRNRVTRFVGHNLDHILFFGAIIFIVIAIAKGIIL